MESARPFSCSPNQDQEVRFQRKLQSESQYPPSKYASERARCSAGSWSRYARVAAAGSMDPDAPLAAAGGEDSTRSAGAAASARARRRGVIGREYRPRQADPPDLADHVPGKQVRRFIRLPDAIV